MSKLGILKRSWEYEGNVPRCGVCKFYVATFYKVTTNSNVKVWNHHCHKGGFTVSPNGVCMHWTGKEDGATLEKSP